MPTGQPIKQDKEYFVCDNCSGTGVDAGKKCQICNGYGFGIYDHNDFLYWGKVVSQMTIWQDKIHLLINELINLSLLIIGILGFAALGLTVYNWGPQAALTLDFWLTKSWYLFVFWLCLFIDLYSFFRLSKQSQLKFLVKYKSYSGQDIITPKKLLINSWSEVVLLKPEEKIDASKAYNKATLKIIEDAYFLAKEFNNQFVTSVHLLAALLSNQEAIVIFGRLGVDLKKIRSKIAHALSQIEKGNEKINFNTGLRWVLLEAYEEAYHAKVNQVTAGELLVALTKAESSYQGLDSSIKLIIDSYRQSVREILDDLEIDEQKIRNVVAWIRMRKELIERWRHISHKGSMRPKNKLDRAYTAVATPFLDQFCTDLTMLAAGGYLDLCVGREKEIEEIFRLIEGGKSGLILVGMPGVGKKSIIEGIAQMMITENVPKPLQDKRLVSLNLAKLVSNAVASEAAGRLMKLASEIQRARNVVLFIDDIEEMGGLTSGGEQTLELSDILAKLISQSSFITLATTTPMAYSSYIEQDSLGQVMQKIVINEMDDNNAILVLEAKSGFLEAKNKIWFSYGALATAVKLTKRYVFDRHLPEKAINVIEEVAVYVKNNSGEGSVVTAEDVSYLISQKVNIPLTKITASEGVKLLHLEEEMHKRMIGQELAVQLVAEALRRARTGLTDAKRPIANFLFLGPTGVGKTELAKTVAETYFGDENNMIRLDMSEYQDQSSIHRLLGAPDVKNGGLLTEAIRKKPFTLLLLDELEKAHPDVLNVFLQVMDDGRLTDSAGRTVSFTNVILIATSNAGTQFIQDKLKEKWELTAIREALIHQELKSYFHPEFLNRFDSIIVFKPLGLPEVNAIAKLLLNKIANRLSEKGINFEFTDAVVEELAVAGFDPLFGARPLRRVLQERVDNVLASYLLQNKLDRRDVVVLDTAGRIDIKKAAKF